MLEINPITQLGCSQCQHGKPQGMGAASDDWKSALPPWARDWANPSSAVAIALAAVLVYMLYRTLFGTRAKNRRDALAKARRDYFKKVSDIREEYAL